MATIASLKKHQTQKTISAIISFGIIAQYVSTKIIFFTGCASVEGLVILISYAILASLTFAGFLRKKIVDKMDESVWFLLLIALFLLMGIFGIIGAVIGLLNRNLIEAVRLGVKVQDVVLIFYAPVVAFAYFFLAKTQRRATKS